MTHRDTRGSMDRGPREVKSHIADREGEIMSVANKNVISATSTTPIKAIAKLMKDNDCRRIPIVDAGTKRVKGVAVAIDLLDFLGGGSKYNIIIKDYGGNFLAAINAPVLRIMKEDYISLDKSASIDDAIKIMLEKHMSAIPITNKEGKLNAIITERDVLPNADELGVYVGDVMKVNPMTASPGMMVSDVAKVMVRNRIRRLPVIENDDLIGVVTVFDILNFIGYGSIKEADAEEALSQRVEKIVGDEVVTLKRNDDIADALKLIRETGFGGFPVVEKEKLVGVLTISDILRALYGR